MREFRTYGSVRGALSNGRPYRDPGGRFVDSGRIAQAGAPLLLGLLLDRVDVGMLALSAGLGLASVVALLALRPAHARPSSTSDLGKSERD